MAEHGGYRKPSSPAAVSGPGALSQRTDGRPTVQNLDNAAYGENKAFRDMQTSAPMSPTPGSPASAGQGQAPTAMPTPLSAPTGMPDQPVTHGADAGPGAGASALGIPDQNNEVDDLKRRYGPILPVLIRMADQPTTSQQVKDQIRYVISKIS